MTPAIILDVLIAALLIAAALRGCWRGLFLSLSGILVLIAAMIGANLGAKALTQPVSDWVTPKIEERIAGTVEKTLEKKGQESGQTLEELLPDSLKGLLDRTGLLDPLRGTLERRAEDSVAATAKAIAAAVARELVETFAFGGAGHQSGPAPAGALRGQHAGRRFAGLVRGHDGGVAADLAGPPPWHRPSRGEHLSASLFHDGRTNWPAVIPIIISLWSAARSVGYGGNYAANTLFQM